MASDSSLSVYRKKLFDALGDSFKEYLSHLKLWFRQKLTKEEFDFEARKLLSAEAVHSHNEFMLALLHTCHMQTAGSSSKRALNSQSRSAVKTKQKVSSVKKKSRLVKGVMEHRMKPENPLNFASEMVPKNPSEDSKISFCARELTLPDVNLVYGRMFVTAWDCGLDSVENDAVKVLMIAIEMQLKSLLLELFATRKAYRLRENCFRHGLGLSELNPYICNTASFKETSEFGDSTMVVNSADHVPSSPIPNDLAEGLAAHEVSCGLSIARPFQPVNLFDLFNVLKVKGSLVSSHSVYAVNMERISVKLSHPSHEELEQENIHQQEKRLREQIKAQQPIAI